VVETEKWREACEGRFKCVHILFLDIEMNENEKSGGCKTEGRLKNK
jgi:hypothetical protein